MSTMQTKPKMNVGTIGHVDHGKTTLTSAISMTWAKHGQWGVKKYEDIDVAKEEKERGITINATTIRYETSRYIYNHTDCPGHKEFRSHMITGTGSGLFDCVILLVAINDSVTPDTIEFIKMCVERGIANFALFINKVDLYDKSERQDYIDLVLAEVNEIFDKVGAKLIAHAAGSALLACGPEGNPDTIENRQVIIKFYDDIESALPTPVRDLDKPFLMQIEHVYSIEGRGVVTAGAVQRGRIAVGQVLEFIGVKKNMPGQENPKVTVTSIEAFKKQQSEAEAGDNVGLLLRMPAGLSKKDLESGDVLALPNTFKTHRVVKVDMTVLTKAEGGRSTAIKSGFRPVFFIGAGQYTGTIYLVKVTDQNGAVIAETDEMKQVSANTPDLTMVAPPGSKVESMIVFDHFVPIVSKRMQIMEGSERVASAFVMKFVEPATE